MLADILCRLCSKIADKKKREYCNKKFYLLICDLILDDLADDFEKLETPDDVEDDAGDLEIPDDFESLVRPDDLASFEIPDDLASFVIPDGLASWSYISRHLMPIMLQNSR
jgi:hypothetical protein